MDNSSRTVPAAAPDAGAPQERAGTKPNRKRLGLYRKYDVRRTDGSDGHDGKHYQCCYFVLDLTHDPHALPALAAYAKSCEADYPMLAHDLRGVVEGNPLMPYKTQIERPELAPAAHQERTEPPLTSDDIDTIVEGIREFICYGDPEIDGLWEPYCLKLLALKATLGDVAAPARAHQEEKEHENDQGTRGGTPGSQHDSRTASQDAGDQ